MRRGDKAEAAGARVIGGEAVPGATAPPEPGFYREAWYRLTRNRAAMAGLIVIALFALLAIFAPILAPADPLEQTIAARLTPPFTNGYILGTDDLGRDLLSRIIHGGASPW